MRPLVAILAICLSILADVTSAGGASQTTDEVLAHLTADRVVVDALEAAYDFRVPANGEDPRTGSPLRTAARTTIFFRAPDRVRINVSWPDREEVFLAVGGRSLAMAGDQTTNTPWPVPPLIFRLLLESDPERVRALLAASGVDAALTAEDGTTDPPMNLVGARLGDPYRPQAWFDSETGRLTRVILPPRGGESGYDLTLSDYGLYKQQVAWPRRLVIRSSDTPAGELVLVSLAVDPQLDEENFDLEEIAQGAATGMRRPPIQDPDLIEIRKMMEWFRKKLQ